MHYYQFNIGDYRRDTAHLSHLEHGIYRSLIDTYMLEESPLSGDMKELERKHLIRTANEKKALRNVLKDFFKFENSMFLHSRCDEDIISYRDKSLKASKSAKKRWEKDAKAMRTHSEGNANHKPITINQEPLTNNQSSSMNKFTERDLADAIAMFEKILLVAQKTKKPNLENWADQFRLMRDQDKLTHDEIWSVFMFANNDPFWSVNILSPKTLRAKFSSLHAKMIGEKNATSKFTGQKVVSKSERRDEAARRYLEENNDDGVAWASGNEVSP